MLDIEGASEDPHNGCRHQRRSVSDKNLFFAR